MDRENEEKGKVVRFISLQERSNEKPKDDDKTKKTMNLTLIQMVGTA